MTEGNATNKEKPFVEAARNMRYATNRSISSLDYSFRVVNQIDRYPPLHLRRHVEGMSAGFNGPSYELVAYLRLGARLHDGHADHRDELGSSRQSVISFRRYVCSVRYAVAADRRLVRRSVPVAASHIKRMYDV
jgi:hypothetical protein